MRPLQFSIRSLLVAATLAALLAFASRFGYVLMIPFMFVALIAIYAWANLYILAPEATKYFTFFGLLGLILVSLLSIQLVQLRDRARRNQALQRLRELGRELQLQREVPNGRR